MLRLSSRSSSSSRRTTSDRDDHNHAAAAAVAKRVSTSTSAPSGAFSLCSSEDRSKDNNNNNYNNNNNNNNSGVVHSLLPLDVGLVGRDQERLVLEQAYDRVCCRVQQAASEIVLVEGQSGMGKSRLVTSILQECIDREGMGILVQGKYGLTVNSSLSSSSSPPYEGLVDAATELCQELVSSEYYLEEVREYLQSVLTNKDDRRLLVNLFPSAQVLLGKSPRKSNDDDEDGGSSTKTMVITRSDSPTTTHKFALKRFLKVVCSFWNAVATVHPVVLFLDDLQWADASSREFLTALAKDTSSTNLLVIGAFREAEFDWSQEAERSLLRITRIQVGPLSQQSVSEMISRATERRLEETSELGEIVHRKTGGNVYFCWQFLESLNMSELLTYSFRTNQWEWATDIADRTDVSDNVAELLAQKMTLLSTPAQMVLMLAACLGHSFDQNVLQIVVLSTGCLSGYDSDICVSEKEGSSKEEAEESEERIFNRALRSAIDAGLIEHSRGDKLKFSHDRVQQVADDMIPEGMDVKNLHYRLGLRILELSRSDSGEDWMLFSAVDLLTRPSEVGTRGMSTEELASLCLEAGHKALAKSAFATAANYADRGYFLLEPSLRWNSYYFLCLRLRTLSAEMHHSYGDHEGALVATTDIVLHAQSIEDSFSAKIVTISIRVSQRDLHGAIQECACLLDELGVKFPAKANQFQVWYQMLKIRGLLKGRRASDLHNLHPLQDPKTVQACRVLHEMSLAAWLSNDLDLTFLTCLTMMRLTLQYGMSQFSSCVFSVYGGTLAHFGRLGEAYDFLWHLRQPILTSLEPLEQAYENGMQAGDVNFAGHCLIMRVILGIYGSMTLDHLETQVRGYCDFLRDYQIEGCLNAILPMFQAVLNLRAKSRDVLVLEGEAIENEALFVRDRESGGDKSSLLYTQNSRLVLLVVLDELELADHERKKQPSEAPSTPYSNCCIKFLSALVCLGLARQRKKKQQYVKSHAYQRQARKYRRQLDKFILSGSINIVPFVKLIEAETLSLRSNAPDQTLQAYQDAIGAAAKCGFRLCKSLALEKTGQHLLERGEVSLARYYLLLAWGEFSDYGAIAKLYQMKERYGETCSFEGDSSQIVSRPSSYTKPHQIRWKGRSQ